MKYRLIQTIDGHMIKSEFDDTNFILAMEVRGFELVGLNHNASQRSELQNRPKFKNLAGPMWDGDGIRYEDWTTYDVLSR